ncbi:hypothetical protein [Microbacterium suwonense]|uniref:Uncharacterized protein n=1 Tax=Microbacterium suwonense TaxID=683047 RepID=A0ABM8FUQ6_9MICO|nr:hypothetical protein [Microbacterium suwonense]BDZ39233.1 hypothetical protein GCM10025863_18470 [Microbacterium suwonense]
MVDFLTGAGAGDGEDSGAGLREQESHVRAQAAEGLGTRVPWRVRDDQRTVGCFRVEGHAAQHGSGDRLLDIAERTDAAIEHRAQQRDPDSCREAEQGAEHEREAQVGCHRFRRDGGRLHGDDADAVRRRLLALLELTGDDRGEAVADRVGDASRLAGIGVADRRGDQHAAGGQARRHLAAQLRRRQVETQVVDHGLQHQ